LLILTLSSNESKVIAHKLKNKLAKLLTAVYGRWGENETIKLTPIHAYEVNFSLLEQIIRK